VTDDVQYVDGLDALLALGTTLEPLLAGSPVTARWPWLSTWARTHRSWTPSAVLVRSTGGVRAAALLASRRRGGVRAIVALGNGQSDYARLPAADGAAPALAHAVARRCAAFRSPWRLDLTQLPGDDAVLAGLRGALPCSELTAADGSPVVRLLPGVDPVDNLERRGRARLNSGRNRLAREGLTATVRYVDDPDELRRSLPRVEQVHRARDRALRGASDLDDVEHRAFWYLVIDTLAQRGEIELALLEIDGTLAAYCLSLLDGPAYRVWDPRMVDAFARYSPGHLLRADLLRRAAADPGRSEFDWMRGLEPYKLETTHDVVPAERLRAWSGPSLRQVDAWARTGRARLSAAGINRRRLRDLLGATHP
jgi:CelD/BcsL family acetyltransferase involved in cellulose biosynthesis